MSTEPVVGSAYELFSRDVVARWRPPISVDRRAQRVSVVGVLLALFALHGAYADQLGLWDSELRKT
ncbi:MAG: hypothetical protein K0Q61_653 [Rhodococcus erythropolis]|nr:hypothetical protein [Rhodococcus erythropolis]